MSIFHYYGNMVLCKTWFKAENLFYFDSILMNRMFWSAGSRPLLRGQWWDSIDKQPVFSGIRLNICIWSPRQRLQVSWPDDTIPLHVHLHHLDWLFHISDMHSIWVLVAVPFGTSHFEPFFRTCDCLCHYPILNVRKFRLEINSYLRNHDI